MERYLEKMDLSNPIGVAKWHERFAYYVTTNDKIDRSNETAYYLTMIGQEAYELLGDLSFPDDLGSKSVNEMKALLLGYLRPAHFQATERARFNSLVRRGDESLRNFLLRLQKQAAKCNYGVNLREQLLDRIIAGVNDPELQKRLLRHSSLTYEKAKDILESWDDVNTALVGQVSQVNFQGASSTHQSGSKRRTQDSRQSLRPPPRPRPQMYTQSNHESRNKSFHHSSQSSGRHRSFPPPTSNRPFSGNPCDSCGGSHLRKHCKFLNAQCHSCSKIGHLAKVCRSKLRNNRTAAVLTQGGQCSNYTDSDTTPDFTSLLVGNSESASHLTQRLTFSSGLSTEFIVDTGSPISFLSFNQFQKVCTTNQLRPTDQRIQGVSGHSLPVKGEAQVLVKCHESDQSTPLSLVITERGPSVLGLDGLRALNVNIVLEVDTSMPSTITTLIHQCSKASGGMKIPPEKLEVTCEPIFRKARPVPYGLQSAVKQNIQEMVNNGILQKVDSSSWATPIVTPLKPDGRVRICGDFRVTVNPYLKQAATTTREVEDMFLGMTGSKFFSKVDLTNAFLQVPLDESSKELTTIHTSWGLFQFQFLPFGLTASPGIFQKVIDKVIHGLPGVRSYQDDILVFANTRVQHDERLLNLLRVLQEKNIQINEKKSIFRVSSLKYLGYLIDGNGIHPNLDRVKAVQKAAKPQNSKELQSFLGFVQYYSKFVRNFASMARPLFDMLSAAHFDWCPETEKAYYLLLNSIIHGEVLRCFQVGSQSHLYVDASELAVGAVLEQDGHPIICISRSLSSSERNYAQTQREALAVIWAVKRLHKFLFGHHFHIYTDHEALKYIFNPSASVGKVTTAMLHRWAIELSAYSYTIHHKPGKMLPHADYLSRYAYKDDPPETESFLVNPLPIDRNLLIHETRLAYGPVISGLRNGWSQSARKKFPVLHAKRHDLSFQADGILLFNDRVLIPPACRQAMLTHLHVGHLGRDKMKSLARMLCWWPSIDNDIATFCRFCERCRQTKPVTHPSWTPWPVTFQAMQRVHVDYCGPFLHTYYALVIEDSYSKYPDVFLTKNPTADFSKWALRRFFAREGIPQVLVSDNGTHFTGAALQDWLKSIGCQSVFTAPRNPRSNGLAENLVRSLKTAIKANEPQSLDELWKAVDSFLHQYRNATHAATGKTPSMLLHGRNMRSSANIDTTGVSFYRGNNSVLKRGIIINQIGQRMFNILDEDDGTLHRRHYDQIVVNAPSTSVASQSSETPPSSLRATPASPLTPTPHPTNPDTGDNSPTVSPTSTAPPTFPVSQQSPLTSSTFSNTLQGSPQSHTSPRRSQRTRRPPTWMKDYQTGRNCNS